MGRLNNTFTLILLISITIDMVMTTLAHLLSIPASVATGVILASTGAAILFGILAILTEMPAEVEV